MRKTMMSLALSAVVMLNVANSEEPIDLRIGDRLTTNFTVKAGEDGGMFDPWLHAKGTFFETIFGTYCYVTSVAECREIFLDVRNPELGSAVPKAWIEKGALWVEYEGCILKHDPKTVPAREVNFSKSGNFAWMREGASESESDFIQLVAFEQRAMEWLVVKKKTTEESQVARPFPVFNTEEAMQ